MDKLQEQQTLLKKEFAEIEKIPINFNLPHTTKGSQNIAYLKNLKLLEVDIHRRYDQKEIMKNYPVAYQKILNKTITRNMNIKL